ncbi:MAG TPA: hypothetical protein VFE85_07370 [Woeseiaceae bacterium]|nr:hypothetical protein [Woeseiaceae bacterium]
MPAANDILDGLQAIANGWPALAALWHVYFGVLAGALLCGYRPSQRLAGILAALPLVSVSVLGFAAANAFNGTVFALLASTALLLAARMPGQRVRIAPWPWRAAGVPMFAFGWLYPHFLAVQSFVDYGYLAPTGLVPCPTLAIIVGVTLLLGGLGTAAWSGLFAASGLFYGTFGAMRLGVSMDWLLSLGSLCLLGLLAAREFRRRRSGT